MFAFLKAVVLGAVLAFVVALFIGSGGASAVGGKDRVAP